MRKLIKYLVIVLLLTILYYGIGLYQARQYTLKTIIPQLRVTHFSLEPADLSPRQLQILLAVEDRILAVTIPISSHG
ncbi:hypothetical protein L0128_06455 [candidate division KSB1 bacterium]|nr:hypothetical protein [candidate division KSB1 bacterium]